MRILTPYEYNLFSKVNIDPNKIKNLDEILETNIPIEYLIHMGPFYNRYFQISQDVLIPRIETEQIVDIAINVAKEKIKSNSKKILKIADVGTGSGCIGITLYLELKDLKIESNVILSDISSKALKIARMNRQSIKEIKVIESDLLNSYNNYINYLDIIVANLPYIPSKRISTLDSSVKDYEPHIALDGGKDGLDLIKKLIYDSSQYMSKGCVLILEIDDSHTLKDFDEFTEYRKELILDEFGHTRFIKIYI